MSKKYSSDKEMQKLFEGFRNSVHTSTKLEESILDTIKGAIGLGGKEEKPAAPEEPAAPQQPKEIMMRDLRYDKNFKNILRKTILSMANKFSTLELSIPRFDMYMLEKSGNFTYHVDANVQLKLGRLVTEKKIRKRIAQISGEKDVADLAGFVLGYRTVDEMAQDLAFKVRSIVHAAAKDAMEAYAKSANLIVKDSYEKEAQQFFQRDVTNLYAEFIGKKIQPIIGQVAVPPNKIGWARHNVSSDELTSYLKDRQLYKVPYSLESLFLG